MGQDEGNSDQSVATGVGSGIDDSAIAFTANHSTGFLHLAHHIDFAHSSRGVIAAILFGHIAQTAGGREVAHGVAGRVLEHIVGHGNEGIFFAKHGAVFAHQRQTIDIGIDHETDVMTTTAHDIADFAQVFFERFGIVGKIAGRFAIEHRHLRNTQLPQEFGDDDTAYRIDRIDSDGEVGTANSFDIDQFQIFHHFDVTLVVGTVAHMASQTVDIGKLVVVIIGTTHHFAGFLGGEKFAAFVQELQSIPLARVVTGSQDDTTTGAFHSHGKFGGGRCGQTDIYHIEAHAHQGTTGDTCHHFAGDTSIVAHNNFTTVLSAHHTFAQTGKGGYRFCDVHWVERIAKAATDGAAKSRD